MSAILVVDDDAKIVALVRTYLERAGFEVVTAGSGPAALEAMARDQPRLMVLDVMLPGLDGLEITRELRERRQTIPVLIMSARGTVDDRIRGLAEGADDYLAKPFSPAELVERVRAILRRTEGGDPGPLLHADLAVDVGRQEVRVGDRAVTLSPVEMRILVALMQAGGRVLTRDQLMDAIYGLHASESLDRSIDVYVGRLRTKLGDDHARPRYVATVRGSGYRLAPL